ncbi:glycosyltransferase family 4 protein [Pseudooceanicola sp. CBS1P-1]|nr:MULTISPECIES: glycosyltransferase family 4 protein [Pseudooceanicola]MBT9383035.1 glycosyltransferase family 4 protein [Pseudooceanicola endophyticus]
MLRIVHLVEEDTPDGIARYLDFLRQDPPMAALARHEILPLSGLLPPGPLEAPDMIISHLPVTWAGLPRLMSLRSRHPRVPMVHVEHCYSEGYMVANPGARLRLQTLLRSAYALFDRVVAVSAAQSDWLSRRGLVHPGCLMMIPPCTPLEALPLIRPPAGPVRRLAALGTLDRQKGFDILIRAFRMLPNQGISLRIYGKGHQAQPLAQLAASDPRIRFMGHLRDPFEAYSDCDAVAIPSRWDPYGLVAMEANAAGRPALLNPVDGLRAQLGRGNIAVPELSEEAWSDALRRLFDPEHPPALPDRLAAGPEETRAGWNRLIRCFLDPQGSEGSRGRLSLVSTC